MRRGPARMVSLSREQLPKKLITDTKQPTDNSICRYRQMHLSVRFSAVCRQIHLSEFTSSENNGEIRIGKWPASWVAQRSLKPPKGSAQAGRFDSSTFRSL